MYATYAHFYALFSMIEIYSAIKACYPIPVDFINW